MNRIQSLTRFFDNLANPILVKEIRQAVKGKFLISVMGLILAAQLLIWYAMTMPSAGSGITGRNTFIWMLSLFGSALGITMPIYAGFRILSERAKQDLLYVSALSPFQIIWGKFLSAAGIILIVFSTFLPFFYLTLLIGGIDTWTITYSLIVVVMTLLIGVMFTIMTLCAVVPLLAKIFLILATLVGLYLLAMVAVLTLFLIFNQNMFPGNDWERFLVSLYWLIGGAIAIGFLIVLAASAISPASSNRAFLPRIYATVAVLLSIPFWLFSLFSFSPAGFFAFDVEVAITLTAFVFFGSGVVFFIVSASGRFQYGIRLRKLIPHSKFKRVLAFPFYSGAANGLVWSLFFIGCGLLLFVVLRGYPDSPVWREGSFVSIYHMISYFNYLAIYSWAGMLLCFWFGQFRPGMWSILLAGSIGGLTSVAYLSFFDRPENTVLILLPNAPAFFDIEIYLICLGSTVINLVVGSLVLLKIVGPQTKQFFTYYSPADEIESSANGPQQGKSTSTLEFSSGD